MSLLNIDLAKPYLKIAFVGLENYIELFNDFRFINSVIVTSNFVVLCVGLEYLLGLFVAFFIYMFLSASLKFFITTLLTMTILIPRVAAALVWRLMYQPEIGVLNYILKSLNLPPQLWHASPKTALLSLVLVDVWQWTSFIVLVLLAGMESIPKDLIEVAEVDGATSLRLLKEIIFPLIKPFSGVALAFRLLDALRTFDTVFIITAGGPGIATETLDIYAYYVGISKATKISYASSLCIVILYTTLLAILLFTKIVQKMRR